MINTFTPFEITAWERTLDFPEQFSNLVCEYAGVKDTERQELEKRVSECFFSSFSDYVFSCHDPIIIYLDVDGVLLRLDWRTYDSILYDYYLRCGYQAEDPKTKVELFDQGALENLSQLLQRYKKSAVVISSAWRTSYTVPELRALFHQFGRYIVDKTPDIKFELRLEEISKHSKDHKVGISVVLDDNDFNFTRVFADRFVHVRDDVLRFWDKDEAIRLINEQQRHINKQRSVKELTMKTLAATPSFPLQSWVSS